MPNRLITIARQQIGRKEEPPKSNRTLSTGYTMASAKWAGGRGNAPASFCARKLLTFNSFWCTISMEVII